MADLTIHVVHSFESGTVPSNPVLNQILAKLDELGAQMSAQSEAIDALLVRVNEDVQHLRDLVDEANARAEAAAANDAAQEDELNALRVVNAEALADAQAAVDRINAIDPVADFPPPPEPDPAP